MATEKILTPVLAPSLRNQPSAPYSTWRNAWQRLLTPFAAAARSFGKLMDNKIAKEKEVSVSQTPQKRPLRLQKRRVDLAQILNEVMARFENLLSGGEGLKLQIKDELLIQVPVDPFLISQALTQLLDVPNSLNRVRGEIQIWISHQQAFAKIEIRKATMGLAMPAQPENSDPAAAQRASPEHVISAHGGSCQRRLEAGQQLLTILLPLVDPDSILN